MREKRLTRVGISLQLEGYHMEVTLFLDYLKLVFYVYLAYPDTHYLHNFKFTKL